MTAALPEIERFALTDIEKNSALWLKLSSHWTQRIEMLRTQNDGDKDEKETATLRGRIAEARANLALGRDQPN